MSNVKIEKTVFLKASPAEVWAFLTEPEKLAIWFHKPKAPLAVGAYAMVGTESGDRLIWGEVFVAEPHSRLEYSFTVAPMVSAGGDATSMVKWTLEKVTGGTRLSLVHEGLPDSAEAFGLILALDKGWDEHLGRMREPVQGQ